MPKYDNSFKACISIWLDRELQEQFTEEARRLGLSRSTILRQLIRAWLIKRESKKRPVVEDFA